MIITTVLLILAFSILGKPVGRLVNRIKDTNWSEIASNVWTSIKSFGLTAGRTVCEPLLKFYYVMQDESTSVGDKALIYGAILYVISPFDLLPRKVLGFFGILDDAAVVAFVIKKIGDKITPEIESRVKATLDEWFSETSPTVCYLPTE